MVCHRLGWRSRGRRSIIAGQPWFVAADACRILDMPTASGTAQWLRGLDADERRLLKRTDLPLLFSGSCAPTLTLISRPGMFKLIGRSNKPEAKAFNRWVRHEVLSQIMDNGGYVTADADMTKVTAAAPANTGLLVVQIVHRDVACVWPEPCREGEVGPFPDHSHPHANRQCHNPKRGQRRWSPRPPQSPKSC